MLRALRYRCSMCISRFGFPDMSEHPSIRRLVTHLKESHRFSPKAIISTVFGDLILPHGGYIWLGSLVESASLFNISASHARTSILRLGYEGWLKNFRVGKLSYYTMSEDVMRDYVTPVYGVPNEAWTNDWLIVFTAMADLPKQAYTKLRQALIWEGVGQLSPHVFIVPAADGERVRHVLGEFKLDNRVQMLSAQTLVGNNPDLVRRMAREAWALSEIEKNYEGFLARFRPLLQVIERHGESLEDETCFVIRTLLMLDYRVIAIRDPHLPSSLLPHPWAGHAAFALCKALYQQVLNGSEAYLHRVMKTSDGPLMPPNQMLWGRFGGLRD